MSLQQNLPLSIYQNHMNFSINYQDKEIKQPKKSINITKNLRIKSSIINRLANIYDDM